MKWLSSHHDSRCVIPSRTITTSRDGITTTRCAIISEHTYQLLNIWTIVYHCHCVPVFDDPCRDMHPQAHPATAFGSVTLQKLNLLNPVNYLLGADATVQPELCAVTTVGGRARGTRIIHPPLRQNALSVPYSVSQVQQPKPRPVASRSIHVGRAHISPCPG